MSIDRLNILMKTLRRDDWTRGLGEVAASLWRTFNNARDALFAPAAFLSLRRCEFPYTIDDNIDFIYRRFGALFRPLQVPYEIAELCRRVHEARPTRVLEIGTAKGGTFYLFCRVAHQNATLLSIDLPHGWFGGGYPRWKLPLYRAFSSLGQHAYFIRADSHADSTLSSVKTILKGDQVDFLFIDADHSFQGIKRDFEMYSALVRRGGLVALHDILPNRFDPDIKVSDFWAHTRAIYNTEQIIFDVDQGHSGIGIVYL